MVENALSAVGTWIGKFFSEMFSGIVRFFLGLAFNLTEPQFDAVWFTKYFAQMFGLAIPITGCIMAFQIINTTMRGNDVSGVAKAITGGLKAMLATGLALPVLTLITTATEAVCKKILKHIGQGIGNHFSYDPGGFIFAFLMVIVVTAVISVIIFFVMAIRLVVIYFAAVILPFAFTGFAGEFSSKWPKRVGGVIITAIFAKFAILVVLGIGASAANMNIVGVILDGTNNPQSAYEAFNRHIVMTGTIGLAAFAPKMIYSLIDFIDLEHLVHGKAQIASSGMQQGASHLASKVMSNNSTTAASANGQAAASGAAATAATVGTAGVATAASAAATAAQNSVNSGTNSSNSSGNNNSATNNANNSTVSNTNDNKGANNAPNYGNEALNRNRNNND